MHTNPLSAVPSAAPCVVLQKSRSTSGKTVCITPARLGTSKRSSKGLILTVYRLAWQWNGILFPFPPDVCTVIWCSEPCKGKRLTSRRNTAKSFTSAPSAQLPSRPLTALKCIWKTNTALRNSRLSELTSGDPRESLTVLFDALFLNLLLSSFCRLVFKCSCEAVFKKKQLLFQHFHQNANKRVTCVFKCPECNSVFPQKRLLMQHFKVSQEFMSYEEFFCKFVSLKNKQKAWSSWLSLS